MWIEYNPNPVGRKVGDCAVRAVAKALKISWDDAFDLLAYNAKQMGDMPSSDAVIGSVLRQNGFFRAVIPNRCPDCYTAGDFVKYNKNGIFVLGFGGHVATAIDGVLYDSWNSSDEIPIYVWYLPPYKPN